MISLTQPPGLARKATSPLVDHGSFLPAFTHCVNLARVVTCDSGCRKPSAPTHATSLNYTRQSKVCKLGSGALRGGQGKMCQLETCLKLPLSADGSNLRRLTWHCISPFAHDTLICFLQPAINTRLHTISY